MPALAQVRPARTGSPRSFALAVLLFFAFLLVSAQNAAGARWRLGPAFEVSLEASLEEAAGSEDPESGLLLRGSRRW